MMRALRAGLAAAWLAASASVASAQGSAPAGTAPTVSLPPPVEGAPVSAGSAPSGPAAKVPPLPAGPAEAAAYTVLEQHCARCHQAGRLTQPTATSLQNILRIDQIARDPALVQPGVPDGSRLYLSILRPEPPHRAGEAFSASNPAPGADDLAKLRAWIAALPPSPETCGGDGASAAKPAASADDILSRLVPGLGEAAKRTRFVSIAHLDRACAAAEDMETYRRGLQKLVNLLSWRPEPVKIDPVGEAGVLLKVDLGALGWPATHWERIQLAAPQPAALAVKISAAVAEATGTSSPVVRGDWLAGAVLSAPLYYDLLGLPATVPELARLLQINPDQLRRSNAAVRTAVRDSHFSRSLRQLERLPLRNGAYWTAYDIIKRSGRAAETLPTAAAAGHDAELSIFTLPNGLPGFFAANARGERVDRAADGLQISEFAGGAPPHVAATCLSCHGFGPTALSSASQAPADVQSNLRKDRDAVWQALARAGAPHDPEGSEPDPLLLLLRRFGEPVTLTRAAAELGVEPARLKRLGDEPASGAAAAMARRIAYAGATRSEFAAMAPALAEALAPEGGSASRDGAAGAAGPGGRPGLVIDPGKAGFNAGDRLSLTVRSPVDCHLTLIDVDIRGRGTVLFPSDFEQNSRIIANHPVRIPSEGAPYSLRLRERGRETLVAICNTAGQTVDGIRHDFERQRFTDLGDYAAFVTQAYATEVAHHATPSAAHAVPAATARGRPARTGGGARSTTSTASPHLAQPVLQSAIVITVD